MGETVKNKVNIIIKTLDSIAKSNELSLQTEYDLSQTFTSIETHVKFNTFFMGIEWDLSDIKNSSSNPDWERNLPPIIKKIRNFMTMLRIAEVEDNLKIIDKKLHDRELYLDKHTLEKFHGS